MTLTADMLRVPGPRCPETTVRRWASRLCHDGVRLGLRRGRRRWLEVSPETFAKAHRLTHRLTAKGIDPRIQFGLAAPDTPPPV